MEKACAGENQASRDRPHVDGAEWKEKIFATREPGSPCSLSRISPRLPCRTVKLGCVWSCPCKACNAPGVCRPIQFEDWSLPFARFDRFLMVGEEFGSFSS